MDSPTYANVLIQLTQQIDNLSKDFIFKGYAALAETLAKPVAGLCVLYLILLGYGITCGLIQAPWKEFIKLVFRIGILYLFAFNWGFFSTSLVAFFVGGSSELSGVVMKVAHLSLPGAHSGINEGLQAAFNEVIRVSAWTWDKATFKHWAPIFTAIMMDLAGITVVGFALFEIIVAKLMLALCLSTAPLFLCFTLSDKTKSFFDRWLGYLVGFSLVLVMVSVVVGFALHFIHWAVGGHYASHAVNVTASDWIPLVIVAIFCVMGIWEAASIAKSIGGACSTSHGSALMGGFLGGALGASNSGQSLAKQSLNLAKKSIPGSVLSNLQQLKGASRSQNLSGIQNQMRGGRDGQ